MTRTCPRIQLEGPPTIASDTLPDGAAPTPGPLSHAGFFHVPLGVLVELLVRFRVPMLEPLRLLPPEVLNDRRSWVVDVKVHMLMPGQWPCIPGWHCDFVPRDADGQLDPFAWVDRSPVDMYLYVSGPPATQFLAHDLARPVAITDHLDITAAVEAENPLLTRVPAHQWVRFTDRHPHRGMPAEEHGWRLFIRVVPNSVCPPASKSQWLRRHSQVYLNAEGFSW